MEEFLYQEPLIKNLDSKNIVFFKTNTKSKAYNNYKSNS